MSSVPPRINTSFESLCGRTTNSVTFQASSTYIQRQNYCLYHMIGTQSKVQLCVYSIGFKSVCVSSPSDQSLSFPYEVMLDPWLPLEHPSKTLIRLCSLIGVFDGHTPQLVPFAVHWLLLYDVKSVKSCIKINTTLVCYKFSKVTK